MLARNRVSPLIVHGGFNGFGMQVYGLVDGCQGEVSGSEWVIDLVPKSWLVWLPRYWSLIWFQILNANHNFCFILLIRITKPGIICSNHK